MNRMMAIVEREMRKFFRSPTLMLASMIFPLVQLIVLGNAFGGKIRDARLGVVDHVGDVLNRQRDAEAMIQTLSEFYRATLAGDAASLSAHFTVTLSGSARRWTLELRPLDEDARLRYARAWRETQSVGLLTVRSVKLFADGALGSRGAAMLAPYSDDPSNTGLLVSREEGQAIIARYFERFPGIRNYIAQTIIDGGSSDGSVVGSGRRIAGQRVGHGLDGDRRVAAGLVEHLDGVAALEGQGADGAGHVPR